MSGESQDDGEAEPEDDGEAFEVDRLVTRAEGAAALRRLADGVATGSVELGDRDVAVTVPERFTLEVEYEQDDEEVELEAELEWPVADGEAVAPEGESGTHDESAEDDEPTEEGGPAGESAPAGPPADVVGVGGEASNARFELYRDRADEWRWRLVHDNGNVIADSGEGYARKATARNGLESVMRNAPGADVVEDAD